MAEKLARRACRQFVRVRGRELDEIAEDTVVADAQARNAALAGEVQDLKQGVAAAEERARTELGMIRVGETFYQIAPAAGAAREVR